MKKLKKVSIIIAIYKSEPFLEKLVKSCINQTYKNIEIILVDDGSPDNSGRMCDYYAKTDRRIRVIHQKNGGTCAARNAGLKIATGDYIMIVDGDDWLENDCISYFMQLIETTGSEMAMSLNLFTTRDRVQIKKDDIQIWSAEKATASIIYPYMMLGPWNKLYSKKIIDKYKISFSVPWFGEGLYFATTVSQHCNFVAVGKRKVYNYRLNNTNSGLSNYGVQKGFNALENTITIKDNLIIKTPMVKNAINWHIWKNNLFLLLQIVGTHSERENLKVYKMCMKYLRDNMLKVLINSNVNLKEKMKIIVAGCSPIFYVNLVIKKNQKGLKKDKMK